MFPEVSTVMACKKTSIFPEHTSICISVILVVFMLYIIVCYKGGLAQMLRRLGQMLDDRSSMVLFPTRKIIFHFYTIFRPATGSVIVSLIQLVMRLFP